MRRVDLEGKAQAGTACAKVLRWVCVPGLARSPVGLEWREQGESSRRRGWRERGASSHRTSWLLYDLELLFGGRWEMQRSSRGRMRCE